MSAAPLPVLVLAGASEAPLRVAFSLSAKAGPAKATVAPSANVASMVLVFSIWSSPCGRLAVPVSKRYQFQNNETPVLFLQQTPTSHILKQPVALMAAILEANLGTGSDGSANAATNFP